MAADYLTAGGRRPDSSVMHWIGYALRRASERRCRSDRSLTSSRPARTGTGRHQRFARISTGDSRQFIGVDVADDVILISKAAKLGGRSVISCHWRWSRSWRLGQRRFGSEEAVAIAANAHRRRTAAVGDSFQSRPGHRRRVALSSDRATPSTTGARLHASVAFALCCESRSPPTSSRSRSCRSGPLPVVENGAVGISSRTVFPPFPFRLQLAGRTPAAAAKVTTQLATAFSFGAFIAIGISHQPYRSGRGRQHAGTSL